MKIRKYLISAIAGELDMGFETSEAHATPPQYQIYDIGVSSRSDSTAS